MEDQQMTIKIIKCFFSVPQPQQSSINCKRWYIDFRDISMFFWRENQKIDTCILNYIQWQMSFQNENIGMMDEGYFVSRGDILKWLNDLLQLNLTKIEQLGSGAVYCQVIDVIHSGAVNMAKVNWKAKNDYEFIQNLRLLQDAFKKIGIKRYVEVEKLAKAKYQDNLEFAQWLKRYYDLNCGDRGNNYLAEERRGGANPDFGFAQKNVVPKTYNATGQIIPKKEPSPPKKTVNDPVPPPPPKKVTTTATSTIPKATRDADRPKKVQQKAKDEKISPGKKEGGNQDLQERVKEMEEKMLMITEIVKSEEDSNIKVHLIAQLLNVALNTNQQESPEPEEKEKEEHNVQEYTHETHEEEQEDEIL